MLIGEWLLPEAKPATTDLSLMAEGLTVPASFALMPVTRLLQPLPAWAKPNHGNLDCQHPQTSTLLKDGRPRHAQGPRGDCMLAMPPGHTISTLDEDTSRKTCLQGVLKPPAFVIINADRRFGSARRRAYVDDMYAPCRLPCGHVQHAVPALHKAVCAANAQTPNTQMPALGRHSHWLCQAASSAAWR
ncbi:hypothetical protein [Luteimonas qiangzhengi]|uniref:hypothetical protein n=1 Tax=Luteimonas sp. MJ146 TaxID=3129240 RepID=UPI0031BA2B07